MTSMHYQNYASLAKIPACHLRRSYGSAAIVLIGACAWGLVEEYSEQ
jgi:hypothetical protein